MLRCCSILRMFPTGRPNPFIFEYWLRATVTPYCRRGKQSRHGRMKRPERLCERRQCGCVGAGAGAGAGAGVWVWVWVLVWVWMLLTGFIGLPDPAHLFVSQKRNIEMIALLDSLLFSGRRCREALRSLRSVSCCLCGGHASGFSRCRGAWGRLSSEESKSLFC